MCTSETFAKFAVMVLLCQARTYAAYLKAETQYSLLEVQRIKKKGREASSQRTKHFFALASHTSDKLDQHDRGTLRSTTL